MKTKFIFIPAFLILALAALMYSCSYMAEKIASKAVDGSMSFDYEDSEEYGDVVTNELNLTGFNTIDANGAVRLVLTQDSIYHVKAEGNESYLEEYKFYVEDGELEVELAKPTSNVNGQTPRVTLYVSAPKLESIEINGATKLQIMGCHAMDSNLSIEANGASKIEIDTLVVDGLEIESNGAGKFHASRIVAKGDIDIESNGAGYFSANVKCRKLVMEINGAGSAVISGECDELRKKGNVASEFILKDLKVGGE